MKEFTEILASIHSLKNVFVEWRQCLLSFSHVTKVVSFWFPWQPWPQLTIKCFQIEKNDNFYVYFFKKQQTCIVVYYISINKEYSEMMFSIVKSFEKLTNSLHSQSNHVGFLKKFIRSPSPSKSNNDFIL